MKDFTIWCQQQEKKNPFFWAIPTEKKKELFKKDNKDSIPDEVADLFGTLNHKPKPL